MSAVHLKGVSAMYVMRLLSHFPCTLCVIAVKDGDALNDKR
jgi:hypothetical protein